MSLNMVNSILCSVYCIGDYVLLYHYKFRHITLIYFTNSLLIICIKSCRPTDSYFNKKFTQLLLAKIWLINNKPSLKHFLFFPYSMANSSVLTGVQWTSLSACFERALCLAEASYNRWNMPSWEFLELKPLQGVYDALTCLKRERWRSNVQATCCLAQHALTAL